MDQLTKVAKFVPTKKTITVEEYAYKVTKVLVLEYRMPEEFITNRDKLFISLY